MKRYLSAFVVTMPTSSILLVLAYHWRVPSGNYTAAK